LVVTINCPCVSSIERLICSILSRAVLAERPTISLSSATSPRMSAIDSEKWSVAVEKCPDMTVT
jgi:hypothetical protein